MDDAAITRGCADTDRLGVAWGDVTLLRLALWTLCNCIVGQQGF